MSAHNEYLETRVMTAPPHQLHLMVVDGALRFARQAEAALEARNLEQSHQALSKARECVCELVSGLKPEEAPEIVERLKALFLFAYRNLVEADLMHDAEKVRDAVMVLDRHRQTWLELIDRLGAEDSTGRAVPAPHVPLGDGRDQHMRDEDLATSGHSWTT